VSTAFGRRALRFILEAGTLAIRFADGGISSSAHVSMRTSSFRRLTLTISALCIALAVCFEQGRLITTLLGRYTNEDHALLWLAATDWMHLSMREPTFYGQPYGVTFESIPMGVLHALGLSFGTALPLALIGMAVAAWWLLARAAWQRGATHAALAALAMPLLLNIEHWVVVGVIGTGAGRLCAAVAAALCLAPGNNARRTGLAVALGGFGAAIDTASALVALPALLWAALSWRSLRLWRAAALGCLCPLAWKAFNAWFDQAHPDHTLHAGWQIDMAVEPLLDNYHNLDRLLRIQSLELEPFGAWVFWSCIAVLLLAVCGGAWRAALAAGCLVGLLAALGSLSKSLDDTHSLWFPAARMTLALPMALWFVASVTATSLATRFRSSIPLRARAWIGAAASLVIVLGSAATFASRASHWQARIDDIERAGLAPDSFPLRTVESIEATCSAVNDAAAEAQTTIVIFPFNRAENYACAALYPSLVTAYPSYERRYWVLEHLSSIATDRMLVWGADAKSCKRRLYRNTLVGCAAVGGEQGLRLDFDPRPPLDLLHSLGIGTRPFGPGCYPNARETCGWWSARYGSES
jgi:hypothetical protein